MSKVVKKNLRSKGKNKNKYINKNRLIKINKNTKSSKKNVRAQLTKKYRIKKNRTKKYLKQQEKIKNVSKDDIFVRRIEYGDMLDIGIEYMKKHNPEVNFKYYNFVSDPNLQDYRIMFLYTTPFNNHPYLFVRQRAEENTENNNEVIILNPLGNKEKQISDEELLKYNDSFDELERNMLVLYLRKNITYRKNILLENNFSILQCSNITNCVRKNSEIRKMKISFEEKEQLMERYESQYYEKGKKIIDSYFNLLEDNDFEEAKAFLKGNKGKYFNKTRLNTFFKNNKKVVGHLEVFIGIYKLLNVIKNIN